MTPFATSAVARQLIAIILPAERLSQISESLFDSDHAFQQARRKIMEQDKAFKAFTSWKADKDKARRKSK